MTAQEPFHHFGSGAGCVPLCGIVPIASLMTAISSRDGSGSVRSSPPWLRPWAGLLMTRSYAAVLGVAILVWPPTGYRLSH
jgi:hypothetical protein